MAWEVKLLCSLVVWQQILLLYRQVALMLCRWVTSDFLGSFNHLL